MTIRQAGTILAHCQIHSLVHSRGNGGFPVPNTAELSAQLGNSPNLIAARAVGQLSTSLTLLPTLSACKPLMSPGLASSHLNCALAPQIVDLSLSANQHDLIGDAEVYFSLRVMRMLLLPWAISILSFEGPSAKTRPSRTTAFRALPSTGKSILHTALPLTPP